MSEPHRQPAKLAVTCDAVCSELETVLDGPTRADILDWALRDGSFDAAVKRLRSAMQTHVFRTDSGPLTLATMIEQLDARTRGEGFHALQAWDYTAHRFTDENLATLMLDFWSGMGDAARRERASLAILLDYYFLHVLALCAMRAWDEGDADATLDRVTELVGHLQGPSGSGQQFVENAETLLVLAVSHYHPHEPAYDLLLERVGTLNRAHRLSFSLVGSAVLGSHLRWGFSIMYKRDLGRLRDDNVTDYPWLLFSLATLMREYARLNEAGIDGTERNNVVDGLLTGLTPDPWAFVDTPPACLADHEAAYTELYELLSRYGEDLVAEFEPHRPKRGTFSPISFNTNFLPNTLVAMVTTALFQGSPQELPLNSLFVADWPVQPDFRAILAKALAYYAGSSLDRLGEHGAALIVYDVGAGIRDFSMTLGTIRKHLIA